MGKSLGSGMNIGQIRYFVAAFEEGSFSAAARRQFVTVQAVSKAVADLERELGDSLFSRKSRSVFPTEFGTAFYARASLVLEEFNKLEKFPEEYARLSQPRPLRFVLCTPEFPKKEQFLGRLSLVLTRGLDTQVECSITRMREGIDGVVSGDVDAAITIGALDNPNIDCTHLYNMPTGIIVGPEHPLAGRDQVCLADLQAYPVLRSEEFDNFNESVLTVYQKNGLQSPVTYAGPCTENFDFGKFLHEDDGYVFCAAIPPLFSEFESVCMVPVDGEGAQQVSICLNVAKAHRGNLNPAFVKLLSDPVSLIRTLSV